MTSPHLPPVKVAASVEHRARGDLSICRSSDRAIPLPLTLHPTRPTHCSPPPPAHDSAAKAKGLRGAMPDQNHACNGRMEEGSKDSASTKLSLCHSSVCTREVLVLGLARLAVRHAGPLCYWSSFHSQKSHANRCQLVILCLICNLILVRRKNFYFHF